MIRIEYEYDNETLLTYSSGSMDSRTIVLPRQDELVDIGGTYYRVETIKHTFTAVDEFLNIEKLEQYIVIRLTRQLALRNI